MAALVYVHSKGLAHGDVKAGNVLIDFKGRAKLADFGSVKKVREESCVCVRYITSFLPLF